MAQLGWIGLGEMGLPMLRRLIGAGHAVSVWARDPARLGPALEAGATAATSAAQLAARCDAVFLCVTDGDAVEQIVSSEDGIAGGARPGLLVIDHSTIHPQTTRALAERLRAHSVEWVDAPVSGGTGGAAAGTLAVFLGGEPPAVERAAAWIRAYGRNLTHLGPAGSGQLAKSCNQAIVASTVAVWAEVLAYARRSGLDPDVVVDALDGGWADSAIRGELGHAIAAGRFARAPGLIILKDLEIVGDMARRNTAPMPVAAAVTALYRSILAQGLETGGVTAIVQLYDGTRARE